MDTENNTNSYINGDKGNVKITQRIDSSSSRRKDINDI